MEHSLGDLVRHKGDTRNFTVVDEHDDGRLDIETENGFVMYDVDPEDLRPVSLDNEQMELDMSTPVAEKAPKIVKMHKYNGQGGDVKHEWLMEDGTIQSMTNPESIHYNFALDRQQYRK